MIFIHFLKVTGTNTPPRDCSKHHSTRAWTLTITPPPPPERPYWDYWWFWTAFTARPKCTLARAAYAGIATHRCHWGWKPCTERRDLGYAWAPGPSVRRCWPTAPRTWVIVASSGVREVRDVTPAVRSTEPKLWSASALGVAAGGLRWTRCRNTPRARRTGTSRWI